MADDAPDKPDGRSLRHTSPEDIKPLEHRAYQELIELMEAFILEMRQMELLEGKAND